MMTASNFHKTIIALFVILPLFASAQLLPSYLTAGDVTIHLSPESPGANQTVKATLEGLGVDLDRSKISWFVNGELEKASVGEKSFSFKTGAIGASVNLIVTIETTDGAKINNTVTITPAEVSLIWEPTSYVPPFYKGKRLYSYGSPVKVIALPEIIKDGQRFSDDELIYKWKVDYKIIQDASGAGKNTIMARGSVPLKPTTVSVEVSTLDGLVSAFGTITAQPQAPLVAFYEDNPRLGILFNKELSDTATLTEQEINLFAVPYFFAATAAADAKLNFVWQMNSQPVSPGGENNQITLRQVGGNAGTAAIALRINHLKAIFQFAAKTLNIAFGEKNNGLLSF
ncbi:MAG: hypothetical protein A3D52_00730 [Candidatus Taylorbacteria bacterium RIFCSPHIGHO2_02_FULL_44_36]|nr:MAG: hypothetical protein A3D52_00730 [Candidatus Taylorbacteria bacterium RIFCSPHIGHO2_02_FULL_44_36]